MSRMSESMFENYKLNIPKLDAEHWLLFQAITNLSLCTDQQEALIMLGDAIELVQQHTSGEQVLMESVGYPHVDYHVESHSACIQELIGIAPILNSGSLVVVKFHATKVFSTWLHHIDTHDRNFSEWCWVQGVKL